MYLQLTSHDPLTLHHHSIKINLFGDKLKISRDEIGRATSLHRYIKNSSACRIASTEHHLNTDRRSQTSKKASQSPQNEVRQKMKIKERERKDFRVRPTCLEKRREGKVSAQSGPHSQAGTQERGLRTSEGESATTRCSEGRMERIQPRDRCPSSSPSWEAAYTASAESGGCYSGSELQGVGPGRGPGLAAVKIVSQRTVTQLRSPEEKARPPRAPACTAVGRSSCAGAGRRTRALGRAIRGQAGCSLWLQR